ncbi:MAG: hypothetical protein U0936_08615 [Planctomycetaceae bacterium]
MKQNEKAQSQHQRWQYDGNVHNGIHDPSTRKLKSRQQISERRGDPQRQYSGNGAGQNRQSKSSLDLWFAQRAGKLLRRRKHQVSHEQKNDQQNEAR